MCGILGWLGNTDRVDLPRFGQALDLLQHRGPDDQGTDALGVPDVGTVILGHRRLSILDLSPLGHQPMASPRTGSVIVFNGEIYNFQDLREELTAKGYAFRSACDTEVLLAAYDEWGCEAFARLNGIFALAIYDPRRRTLVLARDHVGVKPLYYHHDGTVFAFGSELTAVAAAVGSPARVRPDAAAEFFAFGYLSGDLTPLEHYHKLPPAHWLEYDLKSRTLKVLPFWNVLDAMTAPEFTEDDATLTERLEALLLDAVKRQLISDVPLGAFLSGGIDSTLVCALMTRVASRKPKTFTIGFTVPEWDEAPWAKKIAQHLGTEHHEQYLSPSGLEETLIRVAGIYDEPFGDSSAVPTTALCQMVRQHVTVALSGDGGDELYFGYQRYPRGLQYQRFRRLPAAMQWAVRQALKASPSRRMRRWATFLEAPTLASYYSAQNLWPGQPHLFPEPRVLGWQRTAAEIEATLGPTRQAKFMPSMDLRTYLPDDILTKVDRASMSVALEARVPLLDYRLVEFAARLPSRLKYRGGKTKYVLRQILAKYVPRELWERPKSGFAIPLRDWLRKDLRTWVEDELTGDWGWTLGLIDRRAAETVIREHMSGPADHSLLLWAFLSWKSWVRRMNLTT
jgi:asparagine synthase (glutamine-hydrolysing)